MCMINVYIDPQSYIYLGNAFFEDAKDEENAILAFLPSLKKYCFEQGISLHTIDLWDESKASGQDVYISFDHKNFLKRKYWHIKNKNYPTTVPLEKFKKKILFQFESPFIMPEVYADIERVLGLYDMAWFAYKMPNPKAQYFHYLQAKGSVFQQYWNNSNRKFLMLINSNVSPRSPKKFLLALISTGKFPRIAFKELVSERIKAIIFFSKSHEIDLYGSGWNKWPPFPYWFSKKTIQKAYKGRVESKYDALSSYTFSICYENGAFPGYITEKIFDCLYTGTIPIYLGAPDIAEYIPQNCFIHMRDFKNYEELMKFLKSLSQEDVKEYKENGRRFLESEQYKPFTKEHFAEVFVKAIQTDIK